MGRVAPVVKWLLCRMAGDACEQDMPAAHLEQGGDQCPRREVELMSIEL